MRLLILTFCILSSPAKADFLSGNDLYPNCSKNPAALRAFVAAMIDKGKLAAAVMSGYIAADTVGERDSARKDRILDKMVRVPTVMNPYCLPDQATLGQIGDTFCKYLGQNPATRHESGAHLADQAFEEAWPCRVRGGAD